MAASAGRRTVDQGSAEANGGDTFRVSPARERVLLPISAEQMGELLDSKLGNIASREDLAVISNDISKVTQKVDSITAQVRTNASDISLLREAVTRLEGGHTQELRNTVSSLIREESDHLSIATTGTFLALSLIHI